MMQMRKMVVSDHGNTAQHQVMLAHNGNFMPYRIVGFAPVIVMGATMYKPVYQAVDSLVIREVRECLWLLHMRAFGGPMRRHDIEAVYGSCTIVNDWLCSKSMDIEVTRMASTSSLPIEGMEMGDE